MGVRRNISGWGTGLLALALAAGGVGWAAQGAGPAGKGQRESLDRVIAVVNGDLVLESDVEEEERFTAFQPLRDKNPMTRDQLIERLIDRNLILQQLRVQPGPEIADAEVDAELAELRKTIPGCAAYRCNTDAGWQKFVADQGFTVEELQARWKLRMEVLRFIEERFRMGIRITPAEIDAYYKTELVPAYEKQHAAPPPEATITDRIQEILLQQRVTALLEDWLKALRAQGSVRTLSPGEAPR